MAEAILSKKVKDGGANINGTSTITGTYQETISANDPIYSVEDGGINKIYKSDNDLGDIDSSINALGYATTSGVATNVFNDIKVI